MSYWGATGNKGYEWWLFNPRTRLFDACPQLEGIWNATPDSKARTISSHSVGGMVGQIYDDATYRWRHRKLVCIRHESQSWVESKQLFLRTVAAERNGKLQVVLKKYVKGED